MDKQRMLGAYAMALEAHAGQFRKGTSTPYISHPMAVCAIALEYGADEDQAIACLLHDAIEDGGAAYDQAIEQAFGMRVATIVRGCTDGVPDASGIKADWKIRKENYLKHLLHASEDVLLVSACDKLHNARAIAADIDRVGLGVFDRFSVSRDETLWYYASLADVFRERKSPVSWAYGVALLAIKERTRLADLFD